MPYPWYRFAGQQVNSTYDFIIQLDFQYPVKNVYQGAVVSSGQFESYI
jgi:hypothetical protein